MAAQTWSVSDNYDTSGKTGLLNNELVTIDSGATMTQNSDSRWGQQAAVPSSVTITAATGGKWRVDGTETWWIAYDAATGNVPSLNTYSSARDGTNTNTITRSGTVVAEFLSIHTADGVSPSAAGGAMPATGFLKMRWTNTTFADNDVLTLPGGATVTVNTPGTASMPVGGKRGWLNVVLIEAAATAITIPRLGTFEVEGDFYLLGETDGSNDQTFQYYVADQCPMIQVETSPGSGVYEVWTHVPTTRWATATATIATDARGKFFSCSNTGLIEIANTTTAACGQKPASGCKVRVPNIHFGAGTSAAPQTNTVPNVVQATRPETVVTSAGVIDIYCANFSNFYLNLSQPFDVTIEHAGFVGPVIFNEVASPMTLSYMGISSFVLTTDTNPVVFTSCFAGGTISNCKWDRYDTSASGEYTLSMTNCVGFDFTSTTIFAFGSSASVNTRGNATTGAATLINCTDLTFTDCFTVGGRMLFTTCFDIVVTNHKYADICTGTTTTTNPQSVCEFTVKSKNITVDGITFNGLTNVHPRTALVLINNCDQVTVKNIGTKASPLSLGSANQTTYLVSMPAASDTVSLKRMYCDNAATGPILFSTNTDNKITIENFWSDAAETMEVQALNCIMKGCRFTKGVTAQTAVYGTHFSDSFTSTTAGRLVISCNEKTTVEPSASAYTIDAGTPAFNSTGGIQMGTLNDQITWTFGYYIIGHTGFTVSAPTITGTNPNNMDLFYDLDQGSGFSGSFKNLSYKRAGGGGSAGTATVTMTSTTGVAVNDYVFGTGIGTNARVQSVDNATTITVTVNNSGAVSGTLTFNQLPFETVTNARTGFNLKVRAITNTTSATNQLQYIRVDTISTTAAQAYQYDLLPVTLSVNAKAAADSANVVGARVFLEADVGGSLPSDAVVTITRSGSTASVAHTAHGMSEGQSVVIRGANQPEYNGIFTISNVTTNAYDYTVSGTPTTPATGTIEATAVVMNAITNASGIATATFAYGSANQPIRGTARKGDSAPYFKPAVISGTITTSGLSSTVFMVSDA